MKHGNVTCMTWKTEGFLACPRLVVPLPYKYGGWTGFVSDSQNWSKTAGAGGFKSYRTQDGAKEKIWRNLMRKLMRHKYLFWRECTGRQGKPCCGEQIRIVSYDAADDTVRLQRTPEKRQYLVGNHDDTVTIIRAVHVHIQCMYPTPTATLGEFEGELPLTICPAGI